MTSTLFEALPFTQTDLEPSDWFHQLVRSKLNPPLRPYIDNSDTNETVASHQYLHPIDTEGRKPDCRYRRRDGTSTNGDTDSLDLHDDSWLDQHGSRDSNSTSNSNNTSDSTRDRCITLDNARRCITLDKARRCITLDNTRRCITLDNARRL
ncbi:unnamed protein product [Sphagnum balticum]